MKRSSAPSGKARILLVNQDAAAIQLLESAHFQLESISSEEIVQRNENGPKPNLVLLHLHEHNLCDLERIEALRRAEPANTLKKWKTTSPFWR